MATQTRLRATDQALSLPELISTICGFLEDDSALAACIRVNSRWAEEATKVLWSHCGSGFLGADSQKFPKMRHLAALTEKPERLQWYANCIQSLEVGIEDADTEHSDGTLDEGRYHYLFKDIDFPRLSEISIQSGPFSHLYTRTSLLLQYLQPSLKKFWIYFGYPSYGVVLSDDLFLAMERRCPRLELLLLSLDVERQKTDGTLSVDCFAHFLRAMKSLTSLELHDGFDDLMSTKTLLSVAEHQSLKVLELPNVPGHYLRNVNIDRDPDISLFPCLERLSIAVSDEGLQILLPHLKALQELVIRPFGQSKDSFQAIASAQLTRLKRLHMRFGPESIVRGSDLLLLVTCARELEELKLPSDQDPEFTGCLDTDEITDTTIEQVARQLPKVRELTLKLEHAIITTQSLLSLGTHCKKLSNCSLTGEIRFDELLSAAGPGLFPALESLSIEPPERADSHPPYENADELITKLTRAAPNLRGLDLLMIGASEGDWDFSSAFNERLRSQRQHG